VHYSFIWKAKQYIHSAEGTIGLPNVVS